MGIPKLWGKNKDGDRGFVFSHIETIYYNWAKKILLKDKLGELDQLIEEKVAKAMMSNQQINDVDHVPTSALAYLMNQNITKNANDIELLNSNLNGIKIYTNISQLGLYQYSSITELVQSMPDNSVLYFTITNSDWEMKIYPINWGEVFIQRVSPFRARVFFTSQLASNNINYLYMKYVVNNTVESNWSKCIQSSDLRISISPTTNFDTLTQNGTGWLNTYNASSHGTGSPGIIRTGEGIFENLVYSSNIILQRWNVNGYGIMFRQKTGSAWQAWKSIPQV